MVVSSESLRGIIADISTGLSIHKTVAKHHLCYETSLDLAEIQVYFFLFNIRPIIDCAAHFFGISGTVKDYSGTCNIRTPSKDPCSGLRDYTQTTNYNNKGS